MRPTISLVKKLPLQCGSCVLCTRKCSSPVQQTSSIVKKCIPNTESDLCSTACSSPVQDISSVVKELSLQYRIRSVKYTMFFSRAIHYLGSQEIVFLVQKFNIVVNIFCSSTGLEPQILAKDKRNQAFNSWIYSQSRTNVRVRAKLSRPEWLTWFVFCKWSKAFDHHLDRQAETLP